MGVISGILARFQLPLLTVNPFVPLASTLHVTLSNSPARWLLLDCQARRSLNPKGPIFTLAARELDLWQAGQILDKLLWGKSLVSQFKVSAVVSCYNSEAFILGCLLDLIGQTLYQKGELEIIVVDSGSLENEKSIVADFRQRNPNVRYMRTEHRETLYSAWNRGFQAAGGLFFTNANTDDRHHPEALEFLAKELEQQPEIDLVYALCKESCVANQTFLECPEDVIYDYPEFDPPSALLHYQFGPQPVWRATVHNSIGWFNGSYVAVGDYDFNMRFALRGLKARRVARVLGSFYFNPHSVTSNPRQQIEKQQLLARYRTDQNVLRLCQLAGHPIGTDEERVFAFHNMGRQALSFSLPWSQKKESAPEFAANCFRWALRCTPGNRDILEDLRGTHGSPGHSQLISLAAPKAGVTEGSRTSRRSATPHKRISVFAGDAGNFQFVNPIVGYLGERGYVVQTYPPDNLSPKSLASILNASDLAWFEWGNGPIITASHLPKTCPIICRVHRYETYSQEIKQIEWNRVDRLIFVNPVFENVFREFVDPQIDTKTKISIIPNPVMESIAFDHRRNNFKIAHVSRFQADKNPALMLQVLAAVVAKDPRYRLFMIGRIQEMQLYQYCLKLIEDLRLQDHFVFEGQVENVEPWLEDKSILLSTSIVESQGLGIMEAMMKGIKPVIHAGFGKLEEIYPSKLLFRTVDDAVRIITSPEYESLEYRRWVQDRYGSKTVLPKIGILVDELINPSAVRVPAVCRQTSLGAVSKDSSSKASKTFLEPSLPEDVASPGSQAALMPFSTPLVSICIPTFNRGHFIADAIESTLTQTYSGRYEVVVVDDGSTDDTAEVVARIASPRLRYVRKEHSAGPATRNRAVTEAKGEFILWLDSDDVLMSNSLMQHIAVLQQFPDHDVFYGDLQITDNNLKPLHVDTYEDWHGRNRDLTAAMFTGNRIANPGSMIRRNCYDRFGLYDLSFRRAHDYEWWSRLVKDGKFKHSGIVVAKYRWHEANMSSGTVKFDKSFEARVVHRMVERYDTSELLPQIPWGKMPQNEVEALAFLEVAKILLHWEDLAGATSYVQRSLDRFASPATFQLLRQLQFEAGTSRKVKGDVSHVPVGNRPLMTPQVAPPNSIQGVSLEAAAHNTPGLAKAIDRIQMYLSQGKHELATKILRKELGNSSESGHILAGIEELKPPSSLKCSDSEQCLLLHGEYGNSFPTGVNSPARSNTSPNRSQNRKPLSEKELQELSYWKHQKEAEGKLGNGHYEQQYTINFGLAKSFYDGKRILDVGCGPRGSLEWADHARERVGLDPLAEEYRGLGTFHHRMRYVASGSEAIPFPDDYFDVVCCFNSLDHVNDLGKTIAEIQRVVAPDGLFLLMTDVNHPPTSCEPITYSWDIIKKFEPALELIEEDHFERHPEGLYRSVRDRILYKHDNPELRPGVLKAKFRKNKIHTVEDTSHPVSVDVPLQPKKGECPSPASRPGQIPHPLRIMIASHSFPPYALAGTELYSYFLAKELQQRGHDPIILYPASDPALPDGAIFQGTYDGLRVVRLNRNPQVQKDMSALFRDRSVQDALRPFISTLNLDLVHFQHLSGLTASALGAFSQERIPIVFTVHDAWLLCEQCHFLLPEGRFCRDGPETVEKCLQCFLGRNRQVPRVQHSSVTRHLCLRRQSLREAISYVDTMLVPTRFIKRALAMHGFAHERMILSPLGLHPFNLLPRQPSKSILRLAYIGNICHTKGLDLLIEAFNEQAGLQAQLDIHGKIEESRYYDAVTATVKPGCKVTYHGPYQPVDLPRILAQTDLAVVPSRSENFPTVVRECLFARVPVIGPDVGGVSEIIEDGVNGFLFQPGDAWDLAAKLRLIIDNPQLVDRLRLGIKPVRTMSEDVSHLEKIYAEVRERNRRPKQAVKVKEIGETPSTPATINSNSNDRQVDSKRPPIRSSALAAERYPFKVCICSLEDPASCCAQLRLIQPLGRFRQSVLSDDAEFEWAVSVRDGSYHVDRKPIAKADLVIVQRSFAGPDTSSILHEIWASKKPVIYELDDHLFTIPSGNPHHSYIMKRKQYMEECLQRATAVTVTTPLLKELLSVQNPNIHVLPNLISQEVWKLRCPPSSGAVVIGFFGTPTHLEDLGMIEPALFRVAEKHGSNVAFTFMGCASKAVQRLPGFTLIRFESSYQAYACKLQATPVDIALAPLLDIPFNQCKSNIKWLEYSACGIAGIYSNLAPYNASVQNGKTGLLVENSPDKWFRAIDYLIRNPKRRQAMAEQAHQQVMSEHTLVAKGHLFLDVYRKVLADHQSIKPQPSSLPSGLLTDANGRFFDSQAIGSSLVQLAREDPEIGQVISRISRYMARGNTRLATKIANKELAHLPEAQLLLERLNTRPALVP